MIRFAIRTAALRNRGLKSDGTSHEQATLFPFFDSWGSVKSVLVVLPGSTELLTFEPHEQPVTIPLFGTITIDGGLQRLDDESLAALSRLWHFDPWWLLGDERFERLDATPILKATNAVHRFDQQAKRLFFDRRLKQVTSVIFKSGDGYGIKKFTPTMLPEPERPTPSIARRPNRTGWRIEPIWESSSG